MKKRITLLQLVNNTGQFSYNSYIYAVSFDVYIIGVPVSISNYDGQVACSSTFMRHDLTHTYNMVKTNNVDITKYYESIMRADLTTNEKEACIFTLWYVIHELYNNVDNISLDYIISNLIRRKTVFNVKLSSRYWTIVRDIAKSYLDRSDRADRENIDRTHYTIDISRKQILQDIIMYVKLELVNQISELAEDVLHANT